MSEITKISDRQQITLTDFQNLARDPRDALDRVVGEAIETGQKYAGGAVAITATTRVTVACPLTLYDGGAVFSRDDANGVEIDMLTLLPTSGNKRIIAVVAQGQTVETETEERDFEVDGTVYPPVVEAAATATRVWRKANVATVAGASAPDPVKPTVDSALTVLAYVTLTATEVASVEQATANRIAPLGAVNARLVSVEGWRSETSPVIDGLRSDVAKLANSSRGVADRQMLGRLVEQVARLNEALDVGESAALAETDFYLDAEGSDTENPQFLAKVMEGVRFDDDARDVTALALLNPANTSVVVHPDGLLLPKYTETAIINVWGNDTEVALANGGSQTIEYVKRTVSKQRIRYGDPWTVCSNSVWWQSGRYDAATGIFELNGETFQALSWDGKWVRVRHFWLDTYEEVYWDAVTVTASYTGNVAAQTALCPRAGWLTSIDLGFSRVDTAGDVRVMITRVTASGAPDPKNVLAEVLIPQTSLKTFPEATNIPIDPVQLDGGDRYAVIITTPGNHWLALNANNKFAQGSYFTSTDGAWFQGDISHDIAMRWNVAQFAAPRLTVELDDWNLSGGVAALDLSLVSVGHGLNASDGGLSAITFEVKKSGGGWVAISEQTAGATPFTGLPASLDARMVLQGTTEFMPGIYLGASTVTRTRPRTDFLHISAERVTPVEVAEVEVIATLEHYTEADHDLTISLLTGASFDTEVTASAVTDEILPDGSIKRRATFTGLEVSSFKRKLVGATNSPLNVFHVAAVTDVAYPS